MIRIIFTRHPESAEIPVLPGPTLCIVHKKYRPPAIPDCKVVNFEDYAHSFAQDSMLASKVNLVYVGLTKMINPSNRIAPVWDFLYLHTDSLSKYSIDVVPYRGELWRLWFHWGAVGLPFGDYTYSYLLESHYRAYLDGARADNPLRFDAIRQYAAENVAIDYDRYFADPKVEVVSVPLAVHKDYQRLKAELFDRYERIGPIIRGLAKFAQDVCPQRHIPPEHRIFDMPDDVRIVRTDLKVDEYLTNQILAKIAEVNQVVEVLKGHDDRV